MGVTYYIHKEINVAIRSSRIASYEDARPSASLVFCSALKNVSTSPRLLENQISSRTTLIFSIEGVSGYAFPYDVKNVIACGVILVIGCKRKW